MNVRIKNVPRFSLGYLISAGLSRRSEVKLARCPHSLAANLAALPSMSLIPQVHWLANRRSEDNGATWSVTPRDSGELTEKVSEDNDCMRSTGSL